MEKGGAVSHKLTKRFSELGPVEGFEDAILDLLADLGA